MATLQGKAVKNTYRQVLQIGANNVGVSASLQPVQDGAGVNTSLSLSTIAATVNGDLTITGDLIITGGGIQIKDLIDDTVAALIQNGTGITWTYNDGAATLTGNFTGTTSVVPEGSNLYYTQGRFDSAFAAKSTTNLAEGTNLYFTEARGNANFATNLAASDTDDLDEGVTNLYFSNSRARTALSVTAGTGLSYNNTTGVFNLAAIPNASLTNSSITINGQAVSLGGSVTLTTTNIAEGTNLYWTEARGNSNFATNLAASTTTNLAEGTNLYYTQARFDTAFGNKSTTNLAEGTNLYYTQARFNSALAAKTTTDLAEGTNLYYTDARARLALSSSATGLTYANNSGVFSLTAGYAIPTTVKLGEYDIAYNRSIVSAAVSGTTTKTLSLTQQDANVVTATWTDLGITTINGTANQIAATTVGNTTTLAFTNDVTMPNNLVVSGNLTINGTATYVNTESISSKDPLFEVANTNNTTDAVDIGYYGRYYDAVQERVEFTGLFRDASDAGKFKIFTGLVDEPTNVVNTTGTGYTVATLVANVDGNLNGTANAANILSTARTIAASGDAAWSVSFNGSANVTSALTLANTGVTATTYGTSTAVPTIAVDSKGRITSASNTNITFPVTTVNGFAGTVVLTTSDVAEGTNQYFTTARAQAAITGGASSVVTANLTASRALVSDGSGKIAASATTTTTEIGYLAGVTSALQTQLNGKLNLTGGTLTGGLIGTTGSFSSSGSGDTFTIGHTSGSGIALNITKNGNGEGLYINKASGSGNAATIVGNLGGTTASFSGLLSGTSATFSSTITATDAVLTKNGDITIKFNPNNVAKWDLYYNNADGTIGFFDRVGSAFRMTLAQTGAATFSSSVTANSSIISTTAFGGTFRATDGTNEVRFGSYFNTIGSGNAYDGVIYTTNASSSLSILTGGSTTAKMVITSGGNVGIGANPDQKLVVNQGATGVNQGVPATSGSTQNGILRLRPAATLFGETFDFGMNVASTYAWLQATNTGNLSTNYPIVISPNGGNVGIGASISPTYLLEVSAPGGSQRIRVGTLQNNNNTARFEAITSSTINSANSAWLRVTPGGGFVLGQSSYTKTGGDSGNFANLSAESETSILTVAANGAAVFSGPINAYCATGGNTALTIQNTSNNTAATAVAFLGWNATLTGSIQTYVNVTTYNTSSDYRLKEDLKEFSGLDLVTKLKMYDFKWKEADSRMYGGLAHEIQEVVPYAATGKKDEVNEDGEMVSQGVDYSTLVPLLIKSIQELKAEIDELKAK